MPTTSTEIARYGVSVISDSEPNKLAATVSLFDAAGKMIAFLKFYSSGSPLDPNRFRTDLGYAVVNYPFASLASVLDVLRNEKPVYFTWFDYLPARCFGTVETSRESVGEGERP